MNPVAQRLFDAGREELGRSLAALRGTVGAAETSVLLPRGEGELWFFASSNPALLAAGTPAVPVNASFTGLAFRTGQTIAFADAAGQEAHNKAVDEHLGVRTREFAAIPIHGQSVVGVLTLVNRPAGGRSAPCWQLAIWDGAGGSGPAGTAADVRGWLAASGRTLVVPSPWPRRGAGLPA